MTATENGVTDANNSATDQARCAATTRNLKRKRQRQNQKLRQLAAASGEGSASESKDDVKIVLESTKIENSDKYVVKISDIGSMNGKMNEIRGSILRSAIVAAIDNSIKWRMFVPKFNGSNFYSGLYQVRCADMASLFWLRKIISELPPLWRGCNLDVLVREETLHKKRVLAYIPGTPDPVNLIMPRIHAQNANLNTERWDILDRKVDGQRGQTLVFGLDDDIIEVLKKNNFKIHCGTYVLNLRLADEELVNVPKPINQNNGGKVGAVSGDRINFQRRPRYRGRRSGGRRSIPNDSNTSGNNTTNDVDNSQTENGSAAQNNDSQIANDSIPQAVE